MEYSFESYIKSPFPFEKEIAAYFSANDELTIFEIGACEGEDTIKLRRKFPRSRVFAFEPLPKNIEIIKTHLDTHAIDNVELFDIALSNKNGTATFHVSSGHPDDQPKTDDWDFGNKSSSLLPPKEHLNTHKWMKFEQKISVKTQRLDEFCVENSVNHINFIYMDVQGAELMVLDGAGGMLSKIDIIWLEVEAIELYADQPLKDDVEQFMQDNGFTCIMSTVGEIAGDQLYVSNTLKRKQPFGLLKLIKGKRGN